MRENGRHYCFPKLVSNQLRIFWFVLMNKHSQ